jgi:hypothetical protein
MLQGEGAGPGGLNMSVSGFLAPFLGPYAGGYLMSLCDVNTEHSAHIGGHGCSGIHSHGAGERLDQDQEANCDAYVERRSLWAGRDYVVYHVITSRPEAELQQLRDQQELMDVLGVWRRCRWHRKEPRALCW